MKKINLMFDDLVTENLSDINKKIIMACSKWLDCDTRFYSSSSLKLKDALRGENRILKIIKFLNIILIYPEKVEKIILIANVLK